MRVGVRPDDVAAAAVALQDAAAEVEDIVGSLPVGRTMAIAAAAGLEAVVGGADALTWSRAVSHVEHEVLRAAAIGRAEQAELATMGRRLHRLAAVYAAVEDGVGAALRGLDRFVHAHPALVEGGAHVGHRVALDPLLGLGSRLGWLEERTDAVVVLDRRAPAEVPPPIGLGDLVADDVDVAAEDGLVRVTEVVDRDGRSVWVVAISGTQSWSPAPGENPFDVTADVHAVRSQSSAAAIGVHLALLEAQRSTGRDTSAEPILLTGHSLGGILAVGLAADPAFRHGRRVTGVVTAGSPTGRLSLPRTIGSVALEHRGDPVPRLDGVPGRRGGAWTTVVLDPPPADTDGLGSRAHSGELYVRSAREVEALGRSDPAVESWEQVVAPFTEGEGRRAIAHEYVLTRQWQNPRS
jgi:hypothetical protein